MAEIKSTLDLVMERTRHLTMSDGDKREQAAAEFKTALNGLIMKYLDGDSDVDRFREQLSRLEKNCSFSDREMVVGEIARRIDPEADNRLLLDLLQSTCGLNVSGIQVLLKECAQAVDNHAEAARKRVTGDLKENGILGSAVVPNLDSDKTWVMRRKEIFEQCRESLQAEVRRLAVV
jgi:hypothetical protein